MYFIALYLVLFQIFSETQTLSKTAIGNKLMTKQDNPNPFYNLTSQTDFNNNILSIEASAFRQLDQDLIRLLLEIFNEDITECKANNNNALLTNDLIENLQAFGVPKSNITSLIYEISPIYDLENENQQEFLNEREIIGYKAQKRMLLVLKKSGNFTQIIDSISNAENWNIKSLEFGNSDNLIQEISKELINEAGLDAIRNAKVLAKTLGVKLAGIKDLNIKQIKSNSTNVDKQSSFRKSDFNDFSYMSIVIKINFIIEKDQNK